MFSFAVGLLDDETPLGLVKVPDSATAFVLSELYARARADKSVSGGVGCVFVARDAERMSMLARALDFVAPDIPRLELPAWDCLPYDRVSPNPDVLGRRMSSLSRLARADQAETPLLLLTTVNALIQRVPPRASLLAKSLSAGTGERFDPAILARWLEENGFQRASTVREVGEYAVRGGLVDLFPPGSLEPWRLDFFGDTLESIRSFDEESQRTLRSLTRIELVPLSELTIDSTSITRFRRGFVETFGAAHGDALYEAVSQGRRYQGMEHWLPLFHEHLGTLFDYLPNVPFVLDHLAQKAAGERFTTIADHYEARREAASRDSDGNSYKPLPPAGLYLGDNELNKRCADHPLVTLSSFDDVPANSRRIDLTIAAGRNFAPERAGAPGGVFEAVCQHIRQLSDAGTSVLISSWSAGARDRLLPVLEDHGLKEPRSVERLQQFADLPAGTVAVGVAPLESGFVTGRLAIISEQDILGDRLVRPRQRRSRASDFIAEVTSLQPGDVVVHLDHGIGRFVGLRSIEVTGAAHDCLELHYAGDTRLFLPVENIELLSRYGSDGSEVQLDRLGGGAWQARKAKMKERLREMAGKLIAIAAERALRLAPTFTPPDGAWDEFRARFPYEETDDQLAAIAAVLDDLTTGKPMDRLVCGDVGFGKTEVALRAAFVVAISGKQVAVVVPTTLLARQHFRTFSSRFSGLPINVRHASRLVGAKELADTKRGIADGTVDVVVGTHALLGKSVAFRDLGLLVIDEEQHFGVAHKEKLKELRSDVHVLTLTATPIPRTLQLALSGVRELSLIATPPVDRLAVRTFITPFDALIVREALLRERYRGGQAFYVCPRIADLAERREFLAQHVPEVSVAVAHGQMAASELEDIMNAFYDGKYDVLLSTSIVESGLDIPTANTLVVHRADLFGLAQLYQLKGRVGRSKTRAYAYFTTSEKQKLNPIAERRLKVLQSLDSLGAGFQLASHDLDIRGGGNLLGEEQSGHIREVGYELYQQMLQDAIAEIQSGTRVMADQEWSPQIALGMPVMLPETYVADLNLRLSLYRRLGDLREESDIDAFGAELIDRFGPLPPEAEHLLKVMLIKSLCRRAGIDKLDTGPKGVVISFRANTPPNLQGLIAFIGEQGKLARLRPDQKLVLVRDWKSDNDRVKGTMTLMRRLAAIGDAELVKAA